MQKNEKFQNNKFAAIIHILKNVFEFKFTCKLG